MDSLQRIARNSQLHRFSPAIVKLSFREFSSNRNDKYKDGDDDWNNAWETAWIPEEVSAKSPRAPWEADVNFLAPSDSPIALPADVDSETKAFVEDMNDNWSQRRKSSKNQKQPEKLNLENESESGSLYSLENMKRDYRLKKQRIHAGLWMKEIEKHEEAKLGDSIVGGGDDIEKLLDSCSDIFHSADDDLDNSKISSSTEFKAKPDGWETTSKTEDGNIWEMTQREEDILLQEFERRIAYSKFQIASFIKTHIFSRRRPIDGWKYMIEELGPNARKGKGSVTRLPTLSDASTQPFKAEKTPMGSNFRKS
ncbi:protein GAMETE CELL DEFECTIVE 1, mitochondrial [Humulus lupulus]|uniref:protein GAMETE CELL DEFECTIVE 1, mitochondrial n=1 Tax=Humulus lupulus TaxID=3486 RepID=UPI002B400E4A|nr:protein GAMETE CELL DEFECTIVE 1, mitochondrial [Humulus lupulus]